MRNIQSLDGLRAVSIGLVIVGHIFNAVSSKNTCARAILGNGSLGVSIFFVISGYLITTLLVREFDSEGTISLKNFYVRRAFRILPPYYLYLLAICVVASLGYLSITFSQEASAFLFVWDYMPKVKTWPLEHLWSLSVEEQFYILWPASLIFCLRRSRAAARKLAVVCIVCAPLLRIATHFSHSYYSTQLYFMLHTRMDSLMFGCFAALAQDEAWFERIYASLIRFVYPMMGFVFAVSPVLSLKVGGIYTSTIGYSVEGACIVTAMLWLIRNPQSPLGTVLNWSPVKKIGVLSYSLYLWQTVFLHNKNHSVLARFPLNLLVIFTCALFSYFLVETPALRLREKLVKSIRQTAPAVAFTDTVTAEDLTAV